MKRLISLITVLLLVAAPAAFAQSTTGTIQVIVTDSSGAPLPGVTVTASAPDTTTRRTEVTSPDGTATIQSLEPSNQYTVESSLEGFGRAQKTNVLVRSAQTATVRVTLAMATVNESITVTADAPIVDVTSAAVGQELTLELTESLPTGRSYQSYLQLVPGVMPDDPGAAGNPASRSGLNYNDIAGDLGVSTDNFYYVEGINVTDPVTGTFGANLNTEIIQEQKVLTGGIPAEFAGAPGLLSSVVTKSGSNEFSGSVNYYTQNSSLVAENQHQGASEFSTFDTAATFGGPIVRDRAWFFGSYRIVEREDDVTSQDTNEFLRTVSNEQRQAFGKLSWQVTEKDRVSGTYTDDPTDVSGRRDRDVLNTRDRAQKQGGGRYVLDYNRVFSSNLLLDAAYGEHNGEVSIFAADPTSIRNEVAFKDTHTLAERQLGGEGNLNVNERDTKFAKASLEGIFDTVVGSHTLKFGAETEEHINFRNSNFAGGAQYTSFGSRYLNGGGITGADIASGLVSIIEFDPSNPSDLNGLIRTIDMMTASKKAQ
ncbi:MAG TPA: TonB-dependent receptor [Thermoanaerobaculia bacterium]|nr:TonB-dependent receptor [Thermoanaerobaculia bacterium]